MTADTPPPVPDLSAQLQRLVQALEAAGQAVLPTSPDALLRALVDAAARIFGAAAASILLVREAEGVLEFKVSTGAADRDLVGLRFPLGQGIAGYVAMTGQPIAISKVQQDARFNLNFARSTGYVPDSILATPLLAGDRVIGVMEVLDKIDAASFGMQDMELLALFARPAALAIEQAQSFERLGAALKAGLQALARADPELQAGPLLEILAAREDPGQEHELLELAGLLDDFACMGEAERQAALKVLGVFAGYARSRQRPMRGAFRR